MTREEHKATVTRLLGMVASEHQATASELLTSLSEDYEQTLSESEQRAESIQTLTANNENLRRVNTDLFLKVGNSTPKPTPEPDPKEDEKPMEFSALFNEKGELI